jgi:hypothetical protein
LFNYAKALQNEARQGKGREWQGIEAAAKRFYHDLLDLSTKFEMNSDAMGDCIVAYRVMDPTEMAVSIQI